MATHTPGPWRTPISDRNGFLLVTTAPGWKGNNMLGRFRPHKGGFALSAEANAHLIAAAPDLLAALKRSVDAMEAMKAEILRVTGNSFLPDMAEPIAAARAAIAKAERKD